MTVIPTYTIPGIAKQSLSCYIVSSKVVYLQSLLAVLMLCQWIQEQVTFLLSRSSLLWTWIFELVNLIGCFFIRRSCMGVEQNLVPQFQNLQSVTMVGHYGNYWRRTKGIIWSGIRLLYNIAIQTLSLLPWNYHEVAVFINCGML